MVESQSFVQQHFPLLVNSRKLDMKFSDRKSSHLRPIVFTVAAVVVLLVVFLFHQSAGPFTASYGATAAAQNEATMACLRMQDSLGDFSSNYSGQSDDSRWSSNGLSDAATIKLDEANTNHTQAAHGQITTTVVMGRTKEEPESVAWVQKQLHNITSTAIYVVDDPEAKGLHLERNHGRESIVYLKYIIDHFDNLNDITFFYHPARFTWHNNMLLKEDSAESINRMNRQKVLRDGYVNSRCESWPGCPQWVTYNPSIAEHAIDPHRQQEKFNYELFAKLFPGRDSYPRYFGQPCCSQFAVSREAIRSVGLETFQRLYDWIDGMRSDWNSGRMMEMMWQYIFLDRGTLCPSMQQCYCETYGVCYGNDKSKVKLLETWNDHRARTDELNEQIVAAEKKLREKLAFLHMMASKDSNAIQLPVDEEAEFKLSSDTDPELIALRMDYEFVKWQSKLYKEQVMSEWGVEKSSEWW